MRKLITPQSDSLLGDLGNLLREARQRAKLTQDELALRAGLSRVAYRAIETGTAAPRASTLINLARSLGMEMMLVPKDMVPAVRAVLGSGDEDQPAFTADADEDAP